MERLTERNKNGFAMAACCGKECEYNYVCEVGGFGECRGMDDIIDRLADIEDILGDTYDLDRLRELVEADRQGRALIVTDEMATAMRSGAYVLRDDDLAGAGLNWRPKSRKGEALYISYYKAADMLKEAAETALAKEVDR